MPEIKFTAQGDVTIQVSTRPRYGDRAVRDSRC